jgi:2,3-dihydroxyphenylpropionate 1,2-dioxygenase
MRREKDAVLSYSDEETYAQAGQGGFEIRTYIAAAAAAGGPGDLQFYTAELPIFAVGVTVVKFEVAEAA